MKFAPGFQTVGIGVFAGRAFKKDEIVFRSWMTLYLPENFPKSEAISNYVWPPLTLPLNYGPIANHHESYNTEQIKTSEFGDYNFHVRSGF